MIFAVKITWHHSVTYVVFVQYYAEKVRERFNDIMQNDLCLNKLL